MGAHRCGDNSGSNRLWHLVTAGDSPQRKSTANALTITYSQTDYNTRPIAYPSTDYGEHRHSGNTGN